MKSTVLKLLFLITVTIISCDSKKNITTPEVVYLPPKTLTTPEINLNTLFSNDSLVFIDTNKVVVIVKPDTVKKTIKVKANCPEERVQTVKENVVVEVYKTNWLAIFFVFLLGITISLILKTIK